MGRAAALLALQDEKLQLLAQLERSRQLDAAHSREVSQLREAHAVDMTRAAVSKVRVALARQSYAGSGFRLQASSQGYRRFNPMLSN